MLTQERLKELFNYDPDTGLFTRLVTTGPRGKIGTIAGTKHCSGYLAMQVDYQSYQCHRLAVLYMTGKFPEDQVDHIDGIKCNNKWKNLRDCNNSENQQNQKKAMVNNKSSGLLGVYGHRNGFQALIQVNGKKKYIGTFKTKELAHEAYLKEKRSLHEFNTL